MKTVFLQKQLKTIRDQQILREAGSKEKAPGVASSLIVIVQHLKRNSMVKLYQEYIFVNIQFIRTHGLWALLKVRGWKIWMFMIFYYLVKDSLIYILIPFLIAKKIVS